MVASARNFADENILSSFAKTVENLISILESESEIAINWFKDNHMIGVNYKFQAINAKQTSRTNQIININLKEIKAVSKVKLLGIELDDKLIFNQYTNSICKSASDQLNALIRLKCFLRFEKRKVLYVCI